MGTIFSQWRLYLGRASAFIATIYVITVAPFSLMRFEHQLAIFLGLMLITVFSAKPIFKRTSLKKLADLIDFILIILACVTALYQIKAFEELIFTRPGMPTLADTILGTIMLILVLEATRRTAGWALTLIASLFLVYAFWGNLLPEVIGNRGYSLDRVTNQLYLTMQGFYGIPLQVLIQYVGLFVVFGNILESTGAARFLISLAQTVAGRVTGGLAQVTVLASALMGTITGSAVGNVATSGPVTIPTMKKAGYPGHMAGGVEAVASTGGQIMPPIMGAAAFLMADFLGIPYLEVVKAALLPALLYFLGLMVAIYFFAKKNQLASMNKDEIPNFLEVAKTGIFHVLPLVVVIYILVSGKSPTMAGIWGIGSAILLSFMNRSGRMTFKKLAVGITDAGNSLSTLVPLSAAAGILMGVVSMTGIGPRISGLLIDLSQGSVLVLLILTALTSLIMGMGMTTTAAYIILATLVAPALINLDVFPLAAHLFIFYFGMLSMITPPVSLASFAAAAIARESPNRVSIQAFIMAIPMFILPFFFVYNPALLLQGEIRDLIMPFITSFIGIIAFSAATMGWFIKKATIVERILLVISAIFLLEGGFLTDIIGVSLLGIVAITQIILKPKSLAVNA